MDDEARVLDAERRLHDPEIRLDREAMDALLDPAFELFGISGLLWTRSEILDAVGVESTLFPMEMVGMNARELSPGIWLVTYLSESAGRRARRSSIWRMTPTGPRAVLHQGTRIS